MSRSWLYFGLPALSIEALDDADERFGHAERHWREVDKPLHIHRILLQRSWVDIFRGDFDAARERANEARELLDAWPRHSWLQYARLDDHLGSIWRADALADPAERGGQTRAGRRTQGPCRPCRRLGAPLDDRRRRAHAVGRPRLRPNPGRRVRRRLGWGNTELVSELVEYHSARGSFSTEPDKQTADWTETATAAVPVDTVDEFALVAAGSPSSGGGALTRLGPLPPLQMDPTTAPIMSRYRALAFERYGCDVTADEAAWSTWP